MQFLSCDCRFFLCTCRKRVEVKIEEFGELERGVGWSRFGESSIGEDEFCGIDVRWHFQATTRDELDGVIDP